MKVGSYQSLETGSCHRPVLSEYQYPFSSRWQCKCGAPQRDSSTCSESWIIVWSCCSKLMISVLDERFFRRSKSWVKGSFGSSWGGDHDKGAVKSSWSSAVNLWTNLWKGKGSVGGGSQNVARFNSAFSFTSFAQIGHSSLGQVSVTFRITNLDMSVKWL